MQKVPNKDEHAGETHFCTERRFPFDREADGNSKMARYIELNTYKAFASKLLFTASCTNILHFQSHTITRALSLAIIQHFFKSFSF